MPKGGNTSMTGVMRRMTILGHEEVVPLASLTLEDLLYVYKVVVFDIQRMATPLAQIIIDLPEVVPLVGQYYRGPLPRGVMTKTTQGASTLGVRAMPVCKLWTLTQPDPSSTKNEVVLGCGLQIRGDGPLVLVSTKHVGAPGASAIHHLTQIDLVLATAENIVLPPPEGAKLETKPKEAVYQALWLLESVLQMRLLSLANLTAAMQTGYDTVSGVVRRISVPSSD